MENYTNVPEDIFDDGFKSKQVVKRTFDEKKYLNARLAKGETQKTTVIRPILTMDLSDNRLKFAIPVHIHKIKLTKEQESMSASGYKTFMCIADPHADGDGHCPLCEKKRELYKKAEAATDPVEKKALEDEAKKYVSRVAYIVRCIDRNNEADGIKYWRILSNLKYGCLYDRIKNLYLERLQEHVNIFSYEDGKDLRISVTQGPNNTIIESISDAARQTPLAESVEQKEQWINDDTDWRNFFPYKSKEYLQIVADGFAPFYDKEKGLFVPYIPKQDDFPTEY